MSTWIILMVLCAAISAQAQVTVSKSFQKRAFAVTGFTGEPTIAGQLTEVLKNDVRLSGYLALTPAADAEFVQQGSVRGDRTGLTVECFVTQQASKKSVLSKSYPGSAQDLRRLVHVMADDIVQAITGQRGIAQTKIAFVWQRGSVKELAVMDYDGYNKRQLTYDNSISVRPRWSPDGRKIVYTSYLKTFPDVLEADLYTNQRRRVASYPGLNTGAEFSPDGMTLALTLSKDGNPELYTMTASGGGLRRLTQTRGAESSPTWSPDGESIAYVSDDRGSPQIYLINRSGGEATRLTVSPAYNTEPNWSRPPSGSGVAAMLAVTSRVGGKFQIGLYDGTTHEVRAVVADGGDNEDPSWAPNGRFLVFAKSQGWRSRLYLLDVLTGEQVELPAVEGGASEPAWDHGPAVPNSDRHILRGGQVIMYRKVFVHAITLALIAATMTSTGCKAFKKKSPSGGAAGSEVAPLPGGSDIAGGSRPIITEGQLQHGQFVPLYFDYDSAKIRPGEMAKIETVAAALRGNSKKLVIEGYCDERGTAEYNRALGERRAQAAREELVNMGIDASRISTISYGSERPADPGHDEAAWAKNRRDEFVILAQ